MNTLKTLLSALLCILLLAQCKKKDNENGDVLPPSLGKSGEVIVVIDTLLWNTEVGDELKKTFRAPVPGLPTAEPYFSVRRVSPFQYNNFLQRHRNLIFVTTFEDDTPASNRLKGYFNEESKQRIAKDSSIYHMINKNVNAQDQFVLYLFGQTRQQLINNIRKNASYLREQMHKSELERITRTLYAKNENKKLQKQIESKYGFSIRVPDGYQQAKAEDNFLWLRRYANTDMNVFVSFKEYTSKDMFKPDSILAWRNDIGRNNIFGSGEPDTVSYMMTQDYVPVETTEVNFNGHYAVEARGMWKLKTDRMGGTFLSYTFVDEASRRIYYLEGFVYSPGSDKWDSMRELEAILKTFSIKNKTISTR